MQKSFKIAFVTECYCDNNFSSGGIKLNYILIKELINLNCIVDLYTDSIINYEKKFFNNIYGLSYLDKLRNNYDFILSDKGFCDSDITYIHDHSYPYRITYMSNRYKHYFYRIFNYRRHQKRLKEYNKIKNNLLKTKKIIVSSQVLKQDVIDNFGLNSHDVIILPPPIEVHAILPKKNNQNFTFGISAVGFERKGGYILFKAIKELKKYRKDFKVVFIYQSNNIFVKLLKKIYGIDKYCEFIGIQKEMNKFYSSIDCLLMPSIIEPFGMVATEALSNGCPVITAKHCGAADFIIEGQNGFLYNGIKNADKNIVKVMLNVMNLNKDQLYRMSIQCIESVKFCDAKEFAKKYIEIFDTIGKENIFTM